MQVDIQMTDLRGSANAQGAPIAASRDDYHTTWQMDTGLRRNDIQDYVADGYRTSKKMTYRTTWQMDTGLRKR